MKLQKELLVWGIIFLVTLTGFFLLLEFTPVPQEGNEEGISYLFLTGPAFCASLGMIAFFLIIRFFISKGNPPSPTRFRHVAAAAILALAGIVTWEFSQMFLMERPFNFQPFIGGLWGGFMAILIWLFTKTINRNQKKESVLYR